MLVSLGVWGCGLCYVMVCTRARCSCTAREEAARTGLLSSSFPLTLSPSVPIACAYLQLENTVKFSFHLKLLLRKYSNVMVGITKSLGRCFYVNCCPGLVLCKRLLTIQTSPCSALLTHTRGHTPHTLSLNGGMYQCVAMQSGGTWSCESGCF